MEAATKSTNTIYASKDFFSKLIEEEKQKRIQECISIIQDMLAKLNQVIDKEFVTIKNKKFVYNKTLNMLIADTTRWTCSNTAFNFELFEQDGKKGRIMLEREAITLFHDKRDDNPLIHYNNRNKKDYNGILQNDFYYAKNRMADDCWYDYYYYKCVACHYDNNTSYNYGYIDCQGGGRSSNDYFNTHTASLNIPVCDCSKFAHLRNLFLKEKWIPEGLNEKEEKTLQEIIDLYQKELIVVKPDNWALLGEKFTENVKNGKINSFQDIMLASDDISNYLTSNTVKLTNETKKLFVDHFLECDFLRMDINPYDSKIVEDPNRGHWELWAEQEDKLKINTNTTFVGRNPLADVKNNCIVGIDFGTKSTIVVYQDGNDNTQPMRIGVGKLNKAVDLKDFENPTIMEFINFENFIKDYNAEKGRPHTKWNDLTVSYTASNSLTNINSKSDEFYSFFYDLKQWAGDNKRQVKIKDKSGHEQLLYAYADLTEGDFDPIEIYAYYIGLYINNMNNGIYLNYLLSFPVTYEKKIREKLLKSFEKGIKKSLPQEVLDDEKCMKSFRLKQGASEPEAYAICALQQYGFEPIDDEEVVYAIFDFGGGTTDFDFGIWKAAKEEDIYDYEINHFGSGGDKYLGGENLLELLAYTVFCDNIEECRKQKIVFCKPEECVASESIKYFINQSQEAKMNTKQLMEKLRPFWERKDNDTKEFAEGIKLALFDRDGNPKMNTPLEVNIKKLNDVLYERIEKGIRNFFEAFKLTFGDKSINYMAPVECVNIFLAGNSSKSPIVKEIFDKYIKSETENILEKYNTSNDTFFKVFPPLGTKEAAEIQKTLEIQNDYIIAPTGKTGVAFGLVEGRQGGRIKVVADEKEAKFSYYIGINKRKTFKTMISREEEYNKWHRFITAKNDVFEIYYTDLPEATSNSLSIINISKKILTNDFADENKSIYIRFVKPTVIEYTVGFDEDSIEEQNAVQITLD